MAYEPRPGSGTLFKNETDNPKAPQYRGDLCLSTGEIIKLAGWIKEGAKGKFLSLSIDKPREQTSDTFRGGSAGGGGSGRVAGGGGDDPFDDSIPF